MVKFQKIILILVVSAVVNAEHWVYPNLEIEEAFPKWGGTCDSGNRQSPIDLSTTTTFKGVFRGLKFRNYDEPLLHPKIVNNGHTVKITSDSKLSITGGGLKGEYNFIEMHFHSPSEHTIDNRKYPLELHIVHMHQSYKNITEALKDPNGIAVLGILFHVSSDDSSIISQITDEAAHLAPKSKIGVHRKIFGKLVVKDFLPKDVSKNYFFYKGSLTTPPCSEAVLWTVFTDTIPVSLHQIEEFQKMQTEDGHMLKSNFRIVQKIKGRAVTFIMESRSNIVKPLNSILFAIVAIFTLLNK